MRSALVKSKYSAKKAKKSGLNKTIDFFVKSNYHAYLVGGYVRDLTLGRRPVDVDVVVEGDAIHAARRLHAKLKGKLCIHKEFGTASITTKNERVDLASARVEKYASPAELPHVYPSTIIEDLNRRDFTINAIAMSISRENFGEIFDPFGGLQDIKKGTIRVLHKGSFFDDPTRIFRALRYKNRFGFKIEQQTEILMKESLSKKMIEKLSGQRILNELKLIFAEPTYRKILEDISRLKIFKMTTKELEFLSFLGRYKIYFYLSKINTIKFPLTTEERKVMHDISNIEKIIIRLAKATKNSQIYAILSPVDSEIVILLLSVRPELQDKVKLFIRLKKIKPFIKGNDLKKLGYKPGTRFKQLLHKTFTMQLDKQINSKRQAITFLKHI
jgi:tRNA nucleotidyltransferase (CCA-adding enzyme)